MKVLIIGNSPLPEENVNSRPAAGLRTFQITAAIAKAFNSFELKLVTVAMPECYGEKSVMETDTIQVDNISIERKNISKSDRKILRKIRAEIDIFQPDAIVSVNTFPSYLTSQLKPNCPFWADLNGWIMSEAQAQAFKSGGNEYLGHYFNMEKTILRTADKFSTVSEHQKYAVIGELASLGRLNMESFGYQFTETIPNGTEELKGEVRETEKININQLNKVKNKFKILWLGGYNTWVDEETLFNGVESAMRKCEELIYLSTGGKIEGLDNKTFKRFKEKCEKSEFKDRFIFLGWVKTQEIPAIYKEADVGLNVDINCYETIFGARNRINEMMKFGLPVITTAGSEIADKVETFQTGFKIKNGSPNELRDAILEMYKKWKNNELKELGENGKKFIMNECNYKNTCKPLIKWLKNPRKAPDHNVDIKLNKYSKFVAAKKYLKENGVKKFFAKIWQKLFK